MEQLGSHWTNFHEIWYLNFFRQSVKKNKFSLKSGKSDAYLHECRYIYDHSRSFLFRMKNVSEKSCGENQNTNFMSNIFFSRKSCRYEIMRSNTVERGRPQMTIWRMHIVCGHKPQLEGRRRTFLLKKKPAYRELSLDIKAPSHDLAKTPPRAFQCKDLTKS